MTKKINKLDEKYHIGSVSKQEINEWILKKHYAHRLPSVTKYSFGLFNNINKLCGICLFGHQPIPQNEQWWKSKNYQLFELSRLVIDDNHEKNLLNYFVS